MRSAASCCSRRVRLIRRHGTICQLVQSPSQRLRESDSRRQRSRAARTICLRTITELNGRRIIVLWRLGFGADV